jgi:hypothetical protein
MQQARTSPHKAARNFDRITINGGTALLPLQETDAFFILQIDRRNNQH